MGPDVSPSDRSSPRRLLDSMQGDEKRGIDIDKSYGQPIVEQWKKVDAIRKELHEMVQELEDAANAEMRA